MELFRWRYVHRVVTMDGYDELMLRGSTSSRASTTSGTSLGRIASQLSKFLLGMEENGDCDLFAMKSSAATAR